MYQKYVKRLLDIMLATCAMIILAPVFVAIMIAIKLDDGGSVFFLGNRIGKDCKRFIMIKFRTMIENAPDIRNEVGSTYNAKDDPRVTKVGRILRETSLDELPQLINVIKGDMSLLGPRPSVWDALETYSPDEIDKMKVRPGISGYCQAYYRNSMSARDKRLMDAWYANNVTFWLDVKIFLKSITTVFRREGLYTEPTPVLGRENHKSR